MRAIVLFVLALCIPSFATFIAVLETVSIDKALTPAECRFLTDELRAQAGAALPAYMNYTIMTRENINVMLPPGKSIEDCEGSCIAETGRNIAADYVAQARMLRVFYYLQLWKFYGNVPCYFENLESPYIYEQSTADEVYAKVINELEEIISGGQLKDDYPADQKGHVTKPLAYMIYAEMVMIQNDNSRYGKALGYMQELINSGRYQLTVNFQDIWDESGEWNAESIWEINYFDDNSVRGWGNQLGAGGAVFPRLHGPRDFKANPGDPYEDVDAGWGFSAIPLHSVASFEEGDLRKEFSAFDLDAHGTSGDPGWMATGYCLYKYMCRKGNNKDQKADADLGFNNNLRVYRYAETLLNAAELLLKTGGSSSDASKYVNEVRARAGLAGLSAVTEDEILNERRHEFMGEGKRYFDLVRTGKAASVLTPANDSGGFRTKGWSEDVRYLPIPQDNIDASQGTLKQNGKYGTN